MRRSLAVLLVVIALLGGLTAAVRIQPSLLTPGGIVQLVAGTAGAPALTTQTDTNTGLFWPAADELGLSTGGTERARLHASGFVAGTVAGGSNSNSILTLRGASAGGNGDYVSINAGATEVARLHANALAFVKTDVDIGNAGGSRPNALHVTATVEARGFVQRVHAMTIADNAAGASAATETVTPTTEGYIEITCADADGCNVTLGETSVPRGLMVVFVNGGTNTTNFADTVGVSEIAGAFAAGQYDAITVLYIGTTWIEVARSNN